MLNDAPLKQNRNKENDSFLVCVEWTLSPRWKWIMLFRATQCQYVSSKFTDISFLFSFHFAVASNEAHKKLWSEIIKISNQITRTESVNKNKFMPETLSPNELFFMPNNEHTCLSLISIFNCCCCCDVFSNTYRPMPFKTRMQIGSDS